MGQTERKRDRRRSRSGHRRARSEKRHMTGEREKRRFRRPKGRCRGSEMWRLATAWPCLFSAAPPVNNMQVRPDAKRLLKAGRPRRPSSPLSLHPPNPSYYYKVRKNHEASNRPYSPLRPRNTPCQNNQSVKDRKLANFLCIFAYMKKTILITMIPAVLFM